MSAIVTGEAPPERGATVEIELLLGDSKRPFEAATRVAWASRVRRDGRVAFGLEFVEVGPVERAALARFLAEHRPRAIVALASPDERQLAAAALGHLHLEFADREQELSEEFLRACGALIFFCHDPRRILGFLDAVRECRPGDDAVPGEPPRTPITLCTTVASDVLVPLLSERRIDEVLRPPIDRNELALAAKRSCERWALQVEQSWASVQLEGITLRQQARSQSAGSPDRREPPSTIVRSSAVMQKVCDLIRTVAVHDVPVLLVGETGTGKELAAREVHALSPRADTPFVAQDCGALTDTLLESELFGHVKGAFTGAATDHPGLFQIADGGTIFLDEIQNTSPALQAKLLRVVEEGEVRPVGSPRSRRVDVRLIAACNVDLRTEVKEGRFRADFFYRLNRFPIELPPLRKRREDILPLARFFDATLSERLGRPPAGMESRVESSLISYDWPGNVRELKNAIERAMLLSPAGDPLRWESLPAEVRGGVEPVATEQSLNAQLDEFERQIIKTALDRNAGIIRRAAFELQVNAVTLARRMRRLGLP